MKKTLITLSLSILLFGFNRIEDPQGTYTIEGKTYQRKSKYPRVCQQKLFGFVRIQRRVIIRLQEMEIRPSANYISQQSRSLERWNF